MRAMIAQTPALVARDRHGYDGAMQAIGRVLQILGLVLLPLSMVLELTRILGPDFGVRQMFVMLIFGASAFYLGRLIEGYARG